MNEIDILKRGMFVNEYITKDGIYSRELSISRQSRRKAKIRLKSLGKYSTSSESSSESDTKRSRLKNMSSLGINTLFAPVPLPGIVKRRSKFGSSQKKVCVDDFTINFNGMSQLNKYIFY